MSGVNLITLVCHAPLAGARKRDPNVIHAITLENGMEAMLKGRQAVAACGVKHLRFICGSGPTNTVLVWPIGAKGGLTRCRECWLATGKKRPRKAS